MGDFKNSTVCQICIKSFKDTSRNGFDDIRGITEKLDYLKELGVDYAWTASLFRSSQQDNGYGALGYTAVNSMFGTMEDVEGLIAQAESHGTGYMFGMVFNHTFTERERSQRVLCGGSEYMDYYIFRDGELDAPPTNWQSKFGGPAWEYTPHLKKWYPHLLDVTQADLNWENPQVREELKQVVRFWKDKGVKGLRSDVVNLISESELFEDDDRGDGRRFYTDGPHAHGYLKELMRDTGIGEMVMVGEVSSTSLENCIRYTRLEKHEFSMYFNFHHLEADYKDGSKWEPEEPDHEELKRPLMQWQEGTQAEQGWSAMFQYNHDQPRAVSRFGDDKRYWKESAKMLTTSIRLFRRTPYIFQGEELGMTNTGFKDISGYRDVESINYYEIMQSENKTRKEALDTLAACSRDNGRTPMQWNGTEQAGSTDSVPWIGIPTNHMTIDAEAEMADEDPIQNYHRKLIALRREYEMIVDGGIEFLFQSVPDLFAYSRFGARKEILVFNNLSDRELVLSEVASLRGYSRLIGNYEGGYGESLATLQPYESVAYRVIKWKQKMNDKRERLVLLRH